MSSGRYNDSRVIFFAALSLLSDVGAAMVAVGVAVGVGPIDGLFAPSRFWAIPVLATVVTIKAARPSFVMFCISGVLRSVLRFIDLACPVGALQPPRS